MFFNPIILAQIGIAWLFIRYLWQHDRGAKEPGKALLIACIFGGLATIAALLLETWLLPDTFIKHPDHLTTQKLLGYSLIIGIIEESCKSLPLAIFIYRKKYFNELSDGILYFASAGMIFGLIEDIGYDVRFGSAIGLGRIIAGPYIHAAFCALFGYMLARRKVLKTSWIFVGLAFLLPIALHGIYDFGLFYKHAWSIWTSLGITLVLNIGIFQLYKYSQRADAKLGLGATGSNYYCPYCGKPNPQRFLYCPYCGKRT